jgi:hypothetical protein
MASVLKALILVAETNRAKIKQEVWEFSAYNYEGIKLQDWLGLDKTLLNKQLKKLAKACLAEE